MLWCMPALTPWGPSRPAFLVLAPPHSLLLSLGRRCEICDDGFFGDPLGLSGDPQPCQQCQCSGNVDPNAVGNCDPLSGHCLRCLYNTTGAHCDHCQEGFYGSALAPRPADRCMREYPLPGPTGWGCWAPSPPDQPAALRGCAPGGRFLTFSVSCSESVRFSLLQGSYSLGIWSCDFFFSALII